MKKHFSILSRFQVSCTPCLTFLSAAAHACALLVEGPDRVRSKSEGLNKLSMFRCDCDSRPAYTAGTGMPCFSHHACKVSVEHVSHLQTIYTEDQLMICRCLLATWYGSASSVSIIPHTVCQDDTCVPCGIVMVQGLFKRTNSTGGSSAPLPTFGEARGGRDLADLKAEDRSTLHQVCTPALPVAHTTLLHSLACTCSLPSYAWNTLQSCHACAFLCNPA